MKYFGTDGIRGKAHSHLLDPAFIFRFGRAVGKWLKAKPSKASHHVIIGRDTRGSAGYIFLSLARGLSQEGIRIFDGGICPTPAIASSARMLGLDMGIVITASHNPASDNGIKLFGHGGCKLHERDELEIEQLIDQITISEEDLSRTPSVRYFEARRHYLEAYKHLLPEKSLMGIRIVLDSANGATYRSSADMLDYLGAQVIQVGNNPDGDNINKGVGSEHPEVISQLVRQHSAHLGIAHDGDGDRVILCDQNGEIIDGDAIMAILGRGLALRKQLTGMTVVATIMSNLGLDRCLEQYDVQVKRVGVGDRQVYFGMKAGGYILGGEASGHFIAMQHLPTGDGLLAALLVLKEILNSGTNLKDLASLFRPFPQLKKNIIVRKKTPLEELPGLQSELVNLEDKLGTKGRILLRYSGTEPMIRLLAEAEDSAFSNSLLEELEHIVRSHLPIE